MNKFVRELLPFGSLILVIAILSLWLPDSFLTLDNFLNVLRRSSVYGIIAVGMTFIIISGGIDLSVGSLLALCGMCAAGWGVSEVTRAATRRRRRITRIRSVIPKSSRRSEEMMRIALPSAAIRPISS